MTINLGKPKIRNTVEMQPLGDGRFVLRDSAGYVDTILVLNPQAAFIVSLLDGTRDEKEIVRDVSLMSAGRITVSENDVKQVIQTLEANGFLEGPTFFSIKAKVEAEFAKSALREAKLKGQSYPEKREEAEDFVKAIVESAEPEIKPKGKVIGVISPHIEIMNGLSMYAVAWSFLKKYVSNPDLVVIFGTSHAGGEATAVLTKKDFETPFGNALCHKEIADKLIQKGKELLKQDFLKEEILHKNEHSIEFQVLFAKYLYPDSKILPILCPANEIWLGWKRGKFDTIDIFLEILLEELEKSGLNWIAVAGADLAHIGTRFGDTPVTQYDVSVVRAKDIVSLGAFAEGKSYDFLKSIMMDNNARRVCGLGPIYYLLRMAEIKTRKLQGDVLGWNIWIDETGSAVSFGVAYISE